MLNFSRVQVHQLIQNGVSRLVVERLTSLHVTEVHLYARYNHIPDYIMKRHGVIHISHST